MNIWNGHCKWVTSITNGQLDFIPMYYVDKNEMNEKQALDIRTLEFDADAFAVTQSMVHIIFLYNNFEKKVDIKATASLVFFFWWRFARLSYSFF